MNEYPETHKLNVSALNELADCMDALAGFRLDAMKKMAFIASSDFLDVGADDRLYMTIENPANSGKLIILEERQFGTDRLSNEEPLVYQAFVNPSAVLANATPMANFWIGGPQPAGLVRHEVGNVTMGGIAASTNSLETGGSRTDLKVPAFLAPGVTLGFAVQGAGGGALVSAAKVNLTFLWHERPYTP